MKSILGLAALLTVSSLQAQELSFGDLNYFFKRGELNLLAQSDYIRQTQVEDDQKLQTMGFRNSARLTYGVQDNLNVFLGLAYDLNMKVRDITGNISSAEAPRHSQDGLRTPVIGVDYRLYNQADFGYNVDFGAVARINLQDAERGSSAGAQSIDGNAADARSSVELNARMGRKWNEANEWRAYAGLRFNTSGEAKIKQAAADLNQSFDASLDLLFGGFYQYRPINEFMMTLGLEGTRFGETDGDIQAANSFTQESHLVLDGVFTAKFLVQQNLIVRFNYAQGIHRPAYDITATAGNSAVEQRRFHTYGLGLDYLF